MKKILLASAAILIIGIAPAIALNDTIGVTAGSGKTANLIKFGSNNVISEVGVCDATTENRCLAVSAGGAALVDGSAVTQPISAASLPLPSGAATAAGLTTINTTLGSPFQAGGALAANQSTNVAQMGGTSINSGCVAALSGLVSNTVPGTVCGTFGAWVLNATALGQAVAASSSPVVPASDWVTAIAASTRPAASGKALTVNLSPNPPNYCNTAATIAVNQTTSTDVQTFTNTGFICYAVLVTATQQQVSVVEGTGSVCATGTKAIAGTTTADGTHGMPLGANAGFTMNPGVPLALSAAAKHICVLQSGSGLISGTIWVVDAS
jgi:hypothetical protein